jgi:hypothetical protein
MRRPTHSYMMFSPEENIGFYYSYVSTAASIDPAGDFFDTFYPVSGQQPSAVEVMAAGEDSLHKFEGNLFSIAIREVSSPNSSCS